MTTPVSRLLSSTSFRGTGLHTGAASVVTLVPGTPGAGIRFRFPDGRELPALAGNVVDTGRCTVLGDSVGRVSTVEHLLSACVGLGIRDLTVEVGGPEIPIGDGSASCWIEALQAGGIEAGASAPGRVDLPAPIVVTGKDGAFIAAYPAERLSVTVAIHFPHPMVGTQIARYTPDAGNASDVTTDYVSEIAGARTFGFIEEVEALLAAGLARGGTLDNAIVIYPDHFSTPLRFDNELARHKLLDVLGDLALWGSALLPNADIIAVKPSHRLNTELALRLHEACGDGLSNED